MHEEKGNVKLFTSTDHKGMYRIAFKHQTTNEVYSMQDLKDLRDLITEELGEECEHRGSENGICNGCGKEVYPQPLTEGEGETKIGIISSTEYRQGYWPGCKKENFINQHQKPQQESKEEEYIDGFKIECEHGSRGRCLKCLGLEEPSKKPSERIEEMLENLIGQPAYQSMFATIVAYLDELHKAGKI